MLRPPCRQRNQVAACLLVSNMHWHADRHGHAHACTHATILLTCTACSLHSCLLDRPTWWCAHVQKTWRVVRVETGVIHPDGQNIACNATVSSDPVAALRAMWADPEARGPPITPFPRALVAISARAACAENAPASLDISFERACDLLRL